MKSVPSQKLFAEAAGNDGALLDGSDDFGLIFGPDGGSFAASSFDDSFQVTNSIVSNQPQKFVATASAGPVPMATVADGGDVEISGRTAQSVSFAGTTGTLKIDDAPAFNGQISGLAGSDTLDLADISYGPNTTVTFLGNTTGGTLTVTDGTHTANIDLVGNYLSSTWTLSSDGSGGTDVVDPVAANNWQPLDVGAGGYVDGIDIAPDGTVVVRTDTYGAYLWNGSKWQQLITATSMPAGFVTPNDGDGVYEIQVAPSNSNIIYMMYEGYVFKSTNKGTTWTQTSFAPVTENTSDAYRMDGQKMAVDPNNPNVVYVGTPQNGLFVTTNGGATWQSVSAVPVSLKNSNGIYPGITGIEFDPALGVTAGQTNTIFAASYGNGVYESTNGGVSWSTIGGPSDVIYGTVSSTGVYYVTDGTSLWSYNNNTWTKLVSNPAVAGIETVAVNPSNPNEIVTQSPAGYLNVSYNGGASWSGIDYSSNQVSSTDIPWLAAGDTKNAVVYLSVGGLAFDPAVPNELITSAGAGVWTTSDLPTQNLKSNTPVIWNDQSIGIEQLVANEIIVPPGGNPVLASWDRPFFYISDPNAYPSTYGPVASSNIVAGWSIDYASSNPSFLVGIADWWGTEESGYSTNGGQTWTAFPSFIPGAGTSFMGGTIAASTPTNIIWAPADNQNPYYTLNGGVTWNPITLPGISSWSGFDSSYYYDARTVTADRVLPNTFYLYYAGQGVFETTNGGTTWTKVFSGSISPWSSYNAELQSVPGEAGNLFFTGGPQSNYPTEPFYQSTNSGATWKAISNVTEVNCFGFGAPAPGQSYPSIYIVGWVNNVYGIWQSINDAQSWTQIGTYPDGTLDQIKTITGDPNSYGAVYVGFAGAGYAYLSASGSTAPAATPPTISSIVNSPSSGDLNAGKVVTFTLDMSEVVTVNTAGGTPTLSLNDGGTATYVSGSGTNALTFSYTVVAGQNTPDLTVSGVNLNGATVQDGAGNAANLSLTGLTQGSPQIDTTPPTVSSVTATAGDYDAGKVLTLALNMSAAVNVSGTPTLALNDGGTATYVSGTGSSRLVFSYTVAAGQNTTALQVTGVTGTITDLAGNALSTANLPETFSGVIVDTTPPTVSSVTATAGDYDAGKVLTLALNMSAAVNVSGTPTLALNDGGTAIYVSGTGSSRLVFSYTVAAGQNTTALQVTGVTGTITDLAGNALSTANLPETFSGVIVDTTPPTVSSVTATAGDYDAGKVLTLALNMSVAVNVSGTPTLALNDGGTATYVSGTGSSRLVFSYTVAAGQNTTALQVTGVTGTITDLAGNALSTANLPETFSSVIIDTTPPAAPVITSDTVNNNNTVTLTGTAEANSAVTVYDGTTALGTTKATASGTWSYTTGTLMSGSQVFTATATDAAGNTGIVSNAVDSVINSSAAATVTSVTATPTSGDVESGGNVTITVTMSEIVDVTGTPGLLLNDGGSAIYTSGSGTATLVFRYAVAPGQNTTGLQLTGAVSGGSITDAAGHTALIAPTNLGLQINTDYWKQAVNGTWNTTADWSSPARVQTPASFDLVVLDAIGTYQVTSNINETIAELNTIDTATLAIGGGTFTIINGTGAGVQAGTISIANGATVEISGTFDNTGIVALNATRAAADFMIAGNATLSGNGNVTLSDNAGNAIVSNGAAATLTNVSNTISGAGMIGDSDLMFVNQGTIKATDSVALIINTGSNTISNSGELEATSTGGLDIDSNVSNSKTIEALGTNAIVVIDSTITNATTGLILASGSGAQVDLEGATISGGTLQTSGTNAAIETVTGTNALDGGTISSGSTVDVNSGTTLTLGGTVNNLGTFLVNSGGSLDIDGVVTGGTTEISGTGKVMVALASSENVTFLANSTGELVLDTTSYTGAISGFGANTTQSIDLADINFTVGAKIVSYVANSGNTGGVLTITAGTNTIELQLVGTYKLANFAIKSDGSGGTLLTDPPLVEQMPGNAPATIANGAVLEINTPDKGSVTFAGSTGTLWLDQPSTFTGTVSGFKAQDVIDLSGLTFGAQTTLGYLPNSKKTGGTLSVTNGSQSASIALLGNYIASSFATVSDSHGGTMVVVEASQTGSQSLLSNPQHT